MNNADPNSQNLLKCKELSEFILDNNGSIEDLKKQ
jgi:dephospho-CoA kinase